MTTFNAGTLDDSAPVNRWTINIQGQEWLELAIIQALDMLTKPSYWLESTTTTTEIAAERSTDATITFRKDTRLIGTIQLTAGFEFPDGLLCDGSTYLRVDYPALYAALTGAFIVDDDHFTVPDLINRFILGTDDAHGETGGEENHTLSMAEMPAHTHEDSGHTHIYSSAVAAVGAALVGVPIPSAIPVPANTGLAFVNLSTKGSSAAHNNMPPYMKLAPYIVFR